MAKKNGSFTVKLARPAKNKGGDRYEHSEKGKEDFAAVYIPQSFSRDKSGKPIESFTVTPE